MNTFTANCPKTGITLRPATASEIAAYESINAERQAFRFVNSPRAAMLRRAFYAVALVGDVLIQEVFSVTGPTSFEACGYAFG